MQPDRGRVLLPIARAAIARELGRDHSAPEDEHWLLEPGACFITLRLDGRLRGCIGTLRASRPLVEDVKFNAVGAAFRDPRFAPLGADELELARLEVSLLSPIETLECVSEADALSRLRAGMDGVLFQYGYHQSTFLPQVWEELADPAEFLATLKQKAGLPPDFWDKEVKLARYTIAKWAEEA
jgi:AmmeMemoRadiSam system protein A